MKKVFIFLALIGYLAISCGFAVNYHYCMNKLASARLFESPRKNCGKCGMHTDNSHGCCRDEVKIVKLTDDQKLTPLVAIVDPDMSMVVSFLSSFIATPFQNQVRTLCLNESSPPGDVTDLYLRNRVFRI